MYTALRSKARQLKQSGSDYPFGIFLCDGGCALLSTTQRGVGTVSIDDVIGEFFRQNSSVGFIADQFPPTRTEVFGGIIKELRITGKVYVNPRAAKSVDAEILLAVINRGMAALPVRAQRREMRCAGYVIEAQAKVSPLRD